MSDICRKYFPEWILIHLSSSIACSENGWTDAELGKLWVELLFDPYTRERLLKQSASAPQPDIEMLDPTSLGHHIVEVAPDEWRCLILDGHTSHCTLKFLAKAEECKIIAMESASGLLKDNADVLASSPLPSSASV